MLRSRQSDLEKARSQIRENLSRNEYQLEHRARKRSIGRRRLSSIATKKSKPTRRPWPRRRAEVKELMAKTGELTNQLGALRNEFQTNVSLQHRVAGQDTVDCPLSVDRGPLLVAKAMARRLPPWSPFAQKPRVSTRQRTIRPRTPARPTTDNDTEARPADGDWVGVVANRNSGMGKGLRLVDRLVQALRRAGLKRADCLDAARSESQVVSRSAGDPRCRCLVAVGGDGTVADLLNEQPSVPLTVLPAGTENLVAQHFGLGRDPEVLARTIAAGSPVRVDVGLVAGRRFLLMVGFGFDGDIVTRHHHGRVSRSGSVRPTHRIAYVWPVLRSSFSYRFPPITVRIVDPGAEEVLTGTTVFVFNAPRYALGLPFVPAGTRRRRLARRGRFSQTRSISGFVLSCGRSFAEPILKIRACFIAGPRKWS